MAGGGPWPRPAQRAVAADVAVTDAAAAPQPAVIAEPTAAARRADAGRTATRRRRRVIAGDRRCDFAAGSRESPGETRGRCPRRSPRSPAVARSAGAGRSRTARGRRGAGRSRTAAAAVVPVAQPVAAASVAAEPAAARRARRSPTAAAPAAPVAPPAAASAPSRAGHEAVRRAAPASSGSGHPSSAILAIIGAATIVVQLTRWFLGLDFMQDFLATYPGETPLPEGAPVGLPAWLGWQHFFNVFLIVLIIRSGLQVRTEKRPAAYWTPRWSKGGQGKISLNLWFHQSLDILWLVNGLIFVVLLFATGQWMRVVPTSWEVIPNAVSAGLQYLSLDWPLENGWVNYNSLQVLAYFATIFIAAPLAALTGVRMSGLWPKNATTLNRIYPVEWARAVHFPVMLYFVAFIVVHVALVFLTGALRNLNHMYAAQDADGWLGFWIFVASLVVIAAAWIAARPTVLAPIAGVFGKVGR